MWKVKGSQGKSDKIRELFCGLQKFVFTREFFKFPDSLSEILMHTPEFWYFSLKRECICSINGQFCTFEISHQNLVNILKDLPKTVSRSWEIFPGLFQDLSNTWSKTLKALFCLTLASAIFIKFSIFHQTIALWKLCKMFFISSKKLFSFSRYSNFCISVFPFFSPYQPML